MSDKKLTQQQRIIEYMKEFGSITSLEAFQHIGCTRLSGQIFELKDKGYEFECVRENSKNRYGDSVSYARYILKDDKK